MKLLQLLFGRTPSPPSIPTLDDDEDRIERHAMQDLLVEVKERNIVNDVKAVAVNSRELETMAGMVRMLRPRQRHD